MHSEKHVNLLLLTDIYKLGHIEQFPKSTTKVYSYLEARGSKELDGLIFFGLQYILKEYLTRLVTHDDVNEFIMCYKMARNREPTMFIVDKLRLLADFGYLPVEIKALPEGTYIGLKQILMSITNTHDDFYWLPVTDKEKKSKKGYIKLIKDENGFRTVDGLQQHEEETTYLKTVFKNGKLLIDQSLYTIQEHVNSHLEKTLFERIDGIVCLMGNDCSGKTSICKNLLAKFYSGETNILPMERSVKYNNVLFEELKKLVNPSNLDNVLHLMAFETKPYIQSQITYCAKMINIYYVIIDAPINVLEMRSAKRSEHDKYESVKAFRYYRNKYMEMSLYYGFPQVLNNGTNTIDDVVNEILIHTICYYDRYQKFAIMNISNILNEYYKDNHKYDEFCKFYTRKDIFESNDEKLKQIKLGSNMDVLICKLFDVDYTIIITPNSQLSAKSDKDKFHALTCFECLMRAHIDAQKIIYLFFVDNFEILVQFTNDDNMLTEITKKMTANYLKHETISDCDSLDLIDKLKSFFETNKFDNYDLSDSNINTFFDEQTS